MTREGWVGESAVMAVSTNFQWRQKRFSGISGGLG